MSVKDIIKKVMAPTGYTFSRIDVGPLPAQQLRQVSQEQFFDMYFSLISKEDFFFVQIGANDGVSRDMMNTYVHRYNLAGLLVEPQKDVFAKLSKTYEGMSHLALENAAIGEEDGDQVMYRVKESLHTPENYFDVTAISSFDKSVFEKTVKKRIPHLIEYISDDINEYIEEITVPTLTIDSLTIGNSRAPLHHAKPLAPSSTDTLRRAPVRFSRS